MIKIKPRQFSTGSRSETTFWIADEINLIEIKQDNSGEDFGMLLGDLNDLKRICLYLENLLF